MLKGKTVSNYLPRQVTTLRRDEGGQIAIVMVLALPVVFIIYGLVLNAGVWYLDHQIAQTQVDAAALAAVKIVAHGLSFPRSARRSGNVLGTEITELYYPRLPCPLIGSEC